MSRRKEYVKAIVDELLGDEEKMQRLSNQIYGGFTALQAVYEAVEIYGLDRELLKKHIDRILKQPPDSHAPDEIGGKAEARR